MRPELEQRYLIDKFLNGELSDNELSDFNIQLTKNKTLASDVAAQKIANQLVIENKLLEVRSLLKKHELLTESNGNNNNHLLLSLGGVVAAFFMIGYVYFQFQEGTNLPTKTTAHKTYKPEIITKTDELAKPNILKASQQKNSSQKVSSKLDTAVYLNIKDQEKAEASAEKIEIIIANGNSNSREITPLEAPQKMPCDKISTEIKVAVTQSCENDKNGKLKIESHNIQSKEIEYSLDGEKYYKTSVFDNLSAGMYHIFLKDKDGCIFEDKEWHEIVTKKCDQENEFIFHPSAQGNWFFPSHGTPNFIITILDKSGTVVFKTKSIAGVPNSWDAIGNSGVPVMPGLYLYLIEYDNGSTDKGYITIIM